MKKTIKPRKLALDKSTLRVLCTSDLRDVVGATGARCTLTSCNPNLCHED